MSCTRLWISSLAAFWVISAGAAQAADLALPPPQPCCNNWYLRGDIGFSNQQLGSLYNDNYTGYGSVTNVDKGFDSAPFFGFGIGYNVNNWLRFDVTGEYRGRANFHGLDTTQGPNGLDRYTGSKYEWTSLLNGYVDLGTWNCFTPFVGAGIGFSRNTITNFSDTSEATSADWHSSDASKWNFAWALYAGVGYRVTDNFTIELAYRYIDLGNATTGTMQTSYGVQPDQPPFEFRHLTSNDVRLGLRFTCCDFAPPPPLRSRD